MLRVHLHSHIDLVSMKTELLKMTWRFGDFLHDFTTVFLRRRLLTKFWPLEAKIVGKGSTFFPQIFFLS